MEGLIRFVTERIDCDAFAPGERLPSVRVMAQERGVSRDTVLRAYDKLIASHRIYAIRGSGFYVAQRGPADVRGAINVPTIDTDAMRLVHSDFPLDQAPGSGILRHEEGAQTEIARVLRSILTSGLGVGYGDPFGYVPLRQELCGKLAGEGIEATVDNLITVPGVVAGLTLIIRAFLRPGGAALAEDPCSFIHIAALLAQGVEVRHVPREQDGPDLDVLRALCERYRPRLFLLSSLLQNPTGTCIAPYKAQKLIEIAAEFDMILVDDASYADLLPRPYPAHPAMPLMLLDKLDRVIHVGGFANTVAPAAGIGFVLAGERRLRLPRAYRPVQAMGNVLLQERLLYRLLHEGIYRRRCERIRAHLARSWVTMMRQLSASDFRPPAHGAGLFAWCSLGDGVDAGAVAQRMEAQGYLTAPGRYFSKLDIWRSYMRLNVTTTSAAAVNTLSSSA